jgi:hypothetical protein
MEYITIEVPETFTMDAQGDAVVGDVVQFERAKFSGSYRNAKFVGMESITGTITRESYGADRQQHTFTILQEDGSTLRIKGRNLYKESLMRKPWADESAREKVAAEKHARGNEARRLRDTRISNRLRFA